MKNPIAVQLGRLAKGKKKNYSEEELARRALLAKGLRKVKVGDQSVIEK